MLQIGFQGTVTILTHFLWAVNWFASLMYGYCKVGGQSDTGSASMRRKVPFFLLFSIR
jgi:hypothetical protein